jgi:hypothetical protein
MPAGKQRFCRIINLDLMSMVLGRFDIRRSALGIPVLVASGVLQCDHYADGVEQ